MNEAHNYDLQQLGKRLVELRKTLSKDSGIEWSQPKLAKELKTTQNVIARLEKGLGSIDKLLKLLRFYHEKGFNVTWVIVADNSYINKYRPLAEDPTANQEILKVLERLHSLITGK